jgi:hypothetical protein
MSQSETAEFISKPILWPFRPMLPVKREITLSGGESFYETGFLLEQHGLTIFRYEDRSTIENYATLADLENAGWRVD